MSTPNRVTKFRVGDSVRADGDHAVIREIFSGADSDGFTSNNIFYEVEFPDSNECDAFAEDEIKGVE